MLPIDITFEDLYTPAFKARKQQVLDKYITREYLLAIQNKLRQEYHLNNSFLVGDRDAEWIERVGATDQLVREVALQYNAKELHDFLQALTWYEYDNVLGDIFYKYARKYKLYHPKRRYCNLAKAMNMMTKSYT